MYLELWKQLYDWGAQPDGAEADDQPKKRERRPR
jgi:hypothetical protein